MIPKERLNKLITDLEETESRMKSDLVTINKNVLAYACLLNSYKNTCVIKQILEVYRDLRNINTHEDIQIILDRVIE